MFELGIKVNPDEDQIVFDGQMVKREKHKVYFAFYKPKNVVSTVSDPEGRPCIGDYTKKEKYRLFPVGRLDWDTEGLILVTNDGDFAAEVAHPRYNVTKTYHVKIAGDPSDEKLAKLVDGVSIESGKASALYVERLPGDDTKYDWIKMILDEGKNRQIRQMFEKIGCDVMKLQRVSIGRLNLGNMERGDLKPLNERDLMKIFEKEITPEEKTSRKRIERKEVFSKKKLKPVSKSKLFGK